MVGETMTSGASEDEWCNNGTKPVRSTRKLLTCCVVLCYVMLCCAEFVGGLFCPFIYFPMLPIYCHRLITKVDFRIVLTSFWSEVVLLMIIDVIHTVQIE